MKKLTGLWMALLALSFTTLQAEEIKKGPDAEMMKLGMPSDQHKILEPFVGQWKNKVRWWMEPGAPVEEHTGTTSNEWILGGRFMQAKNIGDATPEQPAFEGLGVTGYDNLKGEFSSMWVDNMSTSMMTSTATYDKKKKMLVESGTYACPITGDKHRPFTAHLMSLGRNRYTYEMYLKDKSGKEFKSLEINYERLK